jgi:hypothetical protein
MLALELLVPPSHHLAQGVVGVGVHHLTVVDVVAVHLLVLAPGLHVQSVLIHDLWAELCR